MSPKSDMWVVCRQGKGRYHENDTPTKGTKNFPKNSIGLVRDREGIEVVVWLIGRNETWSVPSRDVEPVDVLNTGDKFTQKICNVCHCLLPVDQFDKNQRNKHGIIRRPTCQKCRTNIDKRAPKSGQAKQMEKERPAKGSPFICPICRKRSIAGVTARIVADHDHNTGNIRDFICDSCNTGLGRFKNGEDYLRNALEYIVERDTLRHGE